MPGKWVAKMWWEQEVLDLSGTRAAAAAAEEEGVLSGNLDTEERSN